jgi:hypothetical protein
MKFTIEKNENNKIDARLQRAAAQTDPARADEPLLAAFIRAAAPLTVAGGALLDAGGTVVAGVVVRGHIAGNIYTASVSRNSLRALQDDPRIVSVQGGQRLGPA